MVQINRGPDLRVERVRKVQEFLAMERRRPVSTIDHQNFKAGGARSVKEKRKSRTHSRENCRKRAKNCRAEGEEEALKDT